MESRSLILALHLALAPAAHAVESLEAGAWTSTGLQMAPAPQAISTPLHRDFIAIAGGETHSVALTRDGRVLAWGANFDGQLNLPSSVTRGVAAITAGGRFTAALKAGEVIVWGGTNHQLSAPSAARFDVARIAAGWDHMLALKSDGSVLAWGSNDFGQRNTPPEASANIKAIAAGYSHSLALTESGEVIAWGTDRPGAPVGQEAVVPDAARSEVVAIAAAFRYSLALKSDGSVIGWGNGVPPGVAAVVAPVGSGVAALGAGYHHMAFLAEGGVRVIADGGWFDYGQADIPPAALAGVAAVATGHNHTLALKEDGTVVAWGAGSKEDSGENVVAYLHRGQCAVPSVLGKEVAALAADFNHTLALLANGEVHAWGFNNHGQTSIPPDARTSVKGIAAGNLHSVALRTDGRVVAWGGNTEGQCDVPDTALSGVKSIAASGVQTVALKENGNVIAWGNQYLGGLTIPPQDQGNIAAIAAGYEFLLAVKDDGSTVAWGSNISGQITVPAEARSGVTAIAAGAEHALALTSQGRVVAWGWNYFGQTDVPAGALTQVVAIAAGDAHSVALKDDGTVIVWGSGYDKQLQPGVVTGKASAIAAGGAATFRKLALPWPSFPEAAAMAGLAGLDASPDATPFHDGLPNLLKHAFNLNLATPYSGHLPNGIPAGVPKSGIFHDETGSQWRIEFIRRKDPRLSYKPTKSNTLTNRSFVPMTAQPTIENIPGFPAWEHVTIHEPVDPFLTPRFFSRIEVN